MAIKFYKIKDHGGFMSNFYKSRIYIYDRWWNNVEAPYQSQKTYIKDEVDMIWSAKTAKKARDLGQTVTMINNWDEKRVHVMEECLYAKFLQNRDLCGLLLSTGDEELIEDSPVDSFWACGKDGNGVNMLGKLLMKIREDIKNNKYV